MDHEKKSDGGTSSLATENVDINTDPRRANATADPSTGDFEENVKHETKLEGYVKSKDQIKDDEKPKEEEICEEGLGGSGASEQSADGRTERVGRSQTFMDNVPYEHEGLARVHRMLWQLQNK